MALKIKIKNRVIGPGQPTYMIAEMSGNHGQSLAEAVKIIEAAKHAGADAVKLQTYTADTLTIDCDNRYFRIKGTLWNRRKLHDLYGEAYTPWDWQPKLKSIAEKLGLHVFSTPFDATAVDFLEKLRMPAHKVASFELVDIPLLKKIGATRKPVILSTGMSTLAEVKEAVRTLRSAGTTQLALLKCTSAYPARPEEMNLKVIPALAAEFRAPIGLSDHTMSVAAPVAAVALGACIIEKHLTLSRKRPGPDSGFSLEPAEFKAMVEAVRTAEKALGEVRYGLTSGEKASRIFRRSLFVVEPIAAGERFTAKNVRSIRPGYGLHTRYLETVIGRTATRSIARGTPLAWELIKGGKP